mmetsp:Transcript_7341/g.22380  ORF Transcript_7341/g.22380 Transcript_7341/m.22380 type:complete len:575 (+) Transcript_7341:11-1735(+)
MRGGEMATKWWAIAVALAVCVAGGWGENTGTAGVKLPPDTVESLDVDKYLGRWFNILTTNSSDIGNTVRCVTADYSLNDDGSIAVNNNGVTADGELSNARTIARQVAPETDPGKLLVFFAPMGLEYWILQLGPVVDGLYEWAIVSNSRLDSLFLIARDIDRFNARYRRSVIAKLVGKYGFKYSDFLFTDNSADTCKYAARPFSSLVYPASVTEEDLIGRFYPVLNEAGAMFPRCRVTEFRKSVESEGLVAMDAGIVNATKDDSDSMPSGPPPGVSTSPGGGPPPGVSSGDGPPTELPTTVENESTVEVSGMFYNLSIEGRFLNVQGINGTIAIQGLYRNKLGKLMTFITYQKDGSLRVYARNIKVYETWLEENTKDIIRTQYGVETVDKATTECRYPAKTVMKLNIDQYVGAWFQMITNEFSTFFGLDECVTAFYDKLSPVAVNVTNSGTGGRFPKPIPLNGKATILSVTYPGQLFVSFPRTGDNASDGEKDIGNYWIAALGPVINGKYEYAIVIDGTYQSLFVLARDPTRFQRRYRKRVVRLLVDKYGYDPETFKFTKQGEGCTYIPKVEAAI